jgi:hypothetical protein
MTGKVYLAQILEGPLTQAVAWAKEDGRMPLAVEAGAPVHKITGFKPEIEPERLKAGIINVKDPGNSPDLNAIESCWALVKIRLRRMPGKATTLDGLWEGFRRFRMKYHSLQSMGALLTSKRGANKL